MSNKEVISDRQGICMVMAFIFALGAILGTGDPGAGRDIALGTLFGALFAIPLMLVYARILYLFPGKDLFEIDNIIFGKKLGTVISLLFIWYTLYTAAKTLRIYWEFTNTAIFPDTPYIVPVVFLVIICVIATYKGIEVIGRTCEIFAVITASIAIIAAFIFSIPDIHINNAFPVFYNGIKPVLFSSFSSVVHPFGDIVVFLMVFSNLQSKKSSYKIYLVGLLITGFIMTITIFRNIIVLGADFSNLFFFKSQIAVSIIHIGEVFQRLEILIFAPLLINVFAKLSICIFICCKGVQKIFNFDEYRFTIVPIMLLVISLSIIIDKNMSSIMKWVIEIAPYYGGFFEIILPVFVLICEEIKVRRNKS